MADHRRRLLEGLPVTETRMDVAGVSTPVLEGGAGPTLVLLHGPGEFAGKWRAILPGLVARYRVVAPDLPAHGESDLRGGGLDGAAALAWLEALLERTCPSPPSIVGHVLGGALAARFAARRPERLSRLVLVDSLGLAAFRPQARFALTMVGFLARPSEQSYERFMRQCSYDLDGLRVRMGDRWPSYQAYNVELARRPAARKIARLLFDLGLRPIPHAELTRIAAPTSLIWGRHDRATPLRVAEAAAARYGWALKVIENCADDPPRDQPEAFLEALHDAVTSRPRTDAPALSSVSAGGAHV
jgi:pimeloyl-ACP methyl ester carboxylesterase